MNDVADRAGVSLKTVSRYVNGETNIDPALSERVRLAISALGYRRNLAAASIRPGWTSRTVGLVISDLANPYSSTLARAVEDVVVDRGYALITMSSNESAERHDRHIQRLMEHRVDGIIVVPPRQASTIWSALAPPVPPVVFVDRPAPVPGGCSVLADNRGGAKGAVDALIASGARSVAFVGDSLEIYTMRERHRGYVDAVRAAGLFEDTSLVHDTAHSSEESARIVAALLAGKRADAVFAANNRASIGALTAFREQQERVPVIGFDDFEAATLVSPEFSVVTQDVPGIGALAAELLLELVGGRSVVPRHVLATELRLRGSERTGNSARAD